MSTLSFFSKTFIGNWQETFHIQVKKNTFHHSKIYNHFTFLEVVVFVTSVEAEMRQHTTTWQKPGPSWRTTHSQNWQVIPTWWMTICGLIYINIKLGVFLKFIAWGQLHLHIVTPPLFQQISLILALNFNNQCDLLLTNLKFILTKKKCYLPLV